MSVIFSCFRCDSLEKAANGSAALEPLSSSSDSCSSSDWMTWSSSGVRRRPSANKNPYPRGMWEELDKEMMRFTSCLKAVTSARASEQRPGGDR